ncbi:MAG: CinA family protein [Chloroflexota bacterium]
MISLGIDNRTLARQVALKAIERGITLATAESCTAGLVAHLLGLTSGVSAALLGGIVAYANSAKRDLLDVPEHVLERFGAVSEPVALAMAEGARLRFGAGLTVAITGVAGPDGGTAEKPVGLVYIATRGARIQRCERFLFHGDRAENVDSAARQALLMLRDALSTDPT